MINPGDGACFPWLSTIAPNFEHYVINSIKFMYTSSCSSFTQGALAMVPEYDPHNYTQGPPNSLPILMNKIDAVKANVWTNCTMNLRRNIGSKKLVRASHHTTETAEHLRQTDVAVLYVALYNISLTVDSSFGDLFVEYDITLKTPNYGQRAPKCHHTGFATPGVATGFGGGGFEPMLPITQYGEADLVNGPKFNGHSASTAGVLMENLKVASSGGNDVYSTRLHFKEPFQGQLLYHANTITGVADAALPTKVDDLPAVVYFGGMEPNQKANATVRHTIHDSVAPKQTSVTYDISAMAGDVLDLAMGAAGTWLAEEGWMWLIDLATGLLLL